MNRLQWLLLSCVMVLAGATHCLAQTPATQTNNTVMPGASSRFADQQKSPRDTMRLFLKSMDEAVNQKQPAAWERVKACLDLTQANSDRLQNIAQDLWGVIDRLEFIDWDDTHLPDVDQLGKITYFTYFPATRFETKFGHLAQYGEISFEQDAAGVWRFSAMTVQKSHSLFIAFETQELALGVTQFPDREGRQGLRSHIPTSLKGVDRTLLTLEYWQWMSLFIIALLGVALDQVLRTGLRIFCRKLIVRHAALEHVTEMEDAVRPIGLLGSAILWGLLIRALGLPDTAYSILMGAVHIFGVFAAVWGAWRVTDLIAEVLLDKAKQTANKFDDVLIPMIRKTIKIFIVAFGLIYGAQSLHINIIPLVTGLGIGGLAFAFAAKDTIENFFGSVAVILDRPFEVGDWVVIGDVEGTVEELGFRSTRIRTFYNSQITVPNSALVRATVDNYGRRQYRRWKTYLGVQYDTPPEKMIEFVQGIRQLVLDHPYTRKDYFHVYYNRFGASSLEILLYVFHEVPDWGKELEERERLFIDIVKLAKTIGVEFAFPTQTIHMANDPMTVNFPNVNKFLGNQEGKAYT